MTVITSPTLTPPVFEHHHNGLGIEHIRPRLSWRFIASDATLTDWIQTAYEIEIVDASSEQAQVYRVQSEHSVLVPWPGTTLKSRSAVTVRVRCWGKSKTSNHISVETISSWSAPTTAEVALLERDDWKSSFITSSKRLGPNGPLQPLRFSKEFSLAPSSSSPSKARLYITSLGVFDAHINGKPVCDEFMAPGWTSYNHRLNYRVYDVTHLLLAGKSNLISVEVGEGWYATRLGFHGGKRLCYGGSDLALLAQLEIALPSGVQYQIVSDSTWSCVASAIQSSEIYDGEVYDMRQTQSSWQSAKSEPLEDSKTTTRILPWHQAKLVSPEAPPVRVTETRTPVNIFKSKSGKTIIDFGQNLVGKILLKSVQFPEGSGLSFKHAEVLEHGELGVRPLRLARSTDAIISSGEPLENWSPKFTFHGFRYVQVDGWPSETGMPGYDDVSALVTHSDMRRRGFFTCSNLSVNKLHENVVWSLRGNFLSIPTDCPQRDERLGWTGDLQVFCSSATYLYDTVGVLGNWLEDLACEQLEEWRGGIPPLVCPDVLPPGWPHIPQAIWDDVTVLTPMVLYQYSNDTDILDRQFASMRAWIDHGVDRGPDGLWNIDRWQLADWLDPTAPPNDPGSSRTDSVMVADAYLVHVTTVLSQICTILCKDKLARLYSSDAVRLKGLFQHKYITPHGNLMSNTQTGLALAIQFGLYPTISSLRVAARSLSKLVREARFTIATGFAGTPEILHALTSINEPQNAYRMLLEKSCPSWLYPVTMGATTIWERWDSMLPDGSINPGAMTSFNHYALGAVVDWLHCSVGGISPLEPGWKVFKVRPVPGGNLTSAEVRFEGPYGLISCSWRLLNADTKFQLTLVVPPNSKALVTLPSDLKDSVSDEKELCRDVGSGTHHFSCKYQAARWPPKPLIASYESLQEDDIAC